MIRKTSAMVEAGILAAVAIVMALISMYSDINLYSSLVQMK